MSPFFFLATSFYEQPFPETVEGTSTLVRGKIGSSRAQWVEGSDQVKRIFTFYDLEVTEVFKGKVAPKSVIQIRELGGTKDGIGMQVAGTAEFTSGEDVVVTLNEQNKEGSYDISGMMMGKFNIAKDDSGVEKIIGAGMKEPWPLQALRELVQSQGQKAKASTPQTLVQPSSSPQSTPTRETVKTEASAINDQPPPVDMWKRMLILGLGILLGIVFFILRKKSK